MNYRDTKTFDALLRADFTAFLHRCVQTLNQSSKFEHNWHIEAIAYELLRIRSGDNNRLIINLPPRYLKSIITSVAFPAFMLGHNPGRQIIAISYGSDLAAKHAADFRATVESNWYRRIFTKMRVARATDSEIRTTAGGYRKTTSIGGTLTGLGGDCFILDDPQKPADAQSEALRNSLNHWYTNTLLSRLDNKETSSIILVMQRVHMLDLAGYLMDRSDEWTILSLPAISESEQTIAVGKDIFHRRLAGTALHPARESLATLKKLRSSLGPDVFAAQYQQSPVPPGGGMIKRHWLHYYDEPPARENATKIILSIDTASKVGLLNDWSVFTVWYVVDKHYYLMAMVRDRFEYPLLRQMTLQLAKSYQPTSILIEDAATGTALGQELRHDGHYNVVLIPVNGDKVSRVFVQGAKFVNGMVLFPRNAAFMNEVERELLTFPQGKTDDIVDSISMALAYDRPGFDYTLSGFQD